MRAIWRNISFFFFPLLPSLLRAKRTEERRSRKCLLDLRLHLSVPARQARRDAVPSRQRDDGTEGTRKSEK